MFYHQNYCVTLYICITAQFKCIFNVLKPINNLRYFNILIYDYNYIHDIES